MFGASTFHVIDFASARLPAPAWQETVTALGVLDNDSEVRELEFTYHDALQRSLSTEESLRLVHDCAEELA